MFTKTECTVIRALHRTMPVRSCHTGRGSLHSEACFDTCYESWLMTARDLAVCLSFERPRLDRDAFVEACRTLPRHVNKVVDRFWTDANTKGMCDATALQRTQKED